MNLRLTRNTQIADGVFGLLEVPLSQGGISLLQTVEDDWLQNRRSVSCIPSGTYTLRRTVYYRHGYETFEVTEVPGRQRILIHPGNTEEDLMGCIGVGLRQGRLLVHDEDDISHKLVEKQAVVASREAFRRFMEWMAPVDEATLAIEWAPGLPV